MVSHKRCLYLAHCRGQCGSSGCVFPYCFQDPGPFPWWLYRPPASWLLSILMASDGNVSYGKFLLARSENGTYHSFSCFVSKNPVTCPSCTCKMQLSCVFGKKRIQVWEAASPSLSSIHKEHRRGARVTVSEGR